MGSDTPKKDKKKKSKRKSSDLLADTLSSDGNINIKGMNGESEKKHKKDKKKKYKKKDRMSADDARPLNGTVTQPIQTEEPSKDEIVPSNKPQGKILSILANSKELHNNSPYQIKTIIGSVALLPTSLNSVPTKIKSLLHTLLLKYDVNLKGVLLSLEDDVNILALNDDNGGKGLVGGRIIDDLPYVHYRFQVHGLVFCPRVGMKLKGQVIECSQTFITLTTNHILSTKISTEKLHQQGFFFNTTTLEWSRERDTSGQLDDNADEMDINDELGPSTSIYLDDTVEFVVEKIRECGGDVMLNGAMPLVSTLG